jgi:hypothetical protein
MLLYSLILHLTAGRYGNLTLLSRGTRFDVSGTEPHAKGYIPAIEAVDMQNTVRILFLEFLQVSEKLSSWSGGGVGRVDDNDSMFLTEDGSLVRTYLRVITNLRVFSNRERYNLLQERGLISILPGRIDCGGAVDFIARAVLGSTLLANEKKSVRISLTEEQASVLDRIDPLLDQKSPVPGNLVLATLD